MNKNEFIFVLREKLSKFPKVEVDERISFYSEIIDDYIEDGLTEDEAVSKIGSIDEIVEQISSEIPLSKIVLNNVKPGRKLRVWEIILLVLGAPIWLSLLVGIAAGLISVFAGLWAVVISIFGVSFGFMIGGSLGAILGILFIFIKSLTEGLMMVGAGLVIAGVGMLLLPLAKLLSQLLIKLIKLIIRLIKKAFVNKEDSDNE